MQKYIKPVDYLIIGHITRDRTPDGFRLGGTASYAALTAKSMGLEAGIVTSFPEDVNPAELDGIQIINIKSGTFTEFQNIFKNDRRVQYLHNLASPITAKDIPEAWLDTPMVHIAPVAREVDPQVINRFHKSQIGVTPQGWLRKWDDRGLVSYSDLEFNKSILSNSDAIILSIDDIDFDESRIDTFNSLTNTLVITEGSNGSRIYWNDDQRHFIAPDKQERDPTGVGDIYAASFFIRLYQTKDPWTAAQFATHIAANSVERKGLESIPTREELNISFIEVL